MSKSRLISTAKLVCYINGTACGWVTSFRWDSATPRKPIMALDSSDPYELVVTTTKVGGTVGLVRPIGNGGLEGVGVVAQFHDLVREKYFTLTLVERSTDTVVFRSDYTVIQNQAWDAGEKGLLRGTFSFEGIFWTNEAKR